MKKHYILLFLFSISSLFSQKSELDQKLSAAAHDSIRHRILIDEIGKAAGYDEKLNLNKQLQISVEKTLNSKNLSDEDKKRVLRNKITYLGNFGFIYQNAKFRDINRALLYYKESISLSKTIGDEDGIAQAYTNTGFAYEDLGNLPLAINYYQNALKIYRKLGKINATTIVLNNMAYVFQSQKKYHKAIEYFEECLKLQYESKEKNERLIGFLLNNIGLCYNNMNQLDLALDYYKKSFAILKKIENEYGVGLLLNNIGENYMQRYNQSTNKNDESAQINLAKTKNYFKQSLAIWEKQEDWVSKSITLKNMGMTALYQNDLDTAILLGNQSINLANKSGLPKAIRSGSELLYKAYKEKGDYKNAFLMLEQYTILNDSLVNENNKKEILEKGFAYEYDKKEALFKAETKAEREKTNFTYFFIIAVLVLMGVLALIYFSFYKKKQKIDKKLRETELSLEIAEAERRRISADLHDDLGAGISIITLLSNRIKTQNSIEDIKVDAQNIFKNTKKIGDKLTEVIWELNAEHNNLEHLLLFIQKQGTMIFKETNTSFSMIIPLDVPKIFISSYSRKQIYFAVKECFTNVFKHADASKVVCTVILNGTLIFQISDDGIGFDLDTKQKVNSGEGLKNLQYRLDNLKGNVDFKSSATGTQILIEIPLP